MLSHVEAIANESDMFIVSTDVSSVDGSSITTVSLMAFGESASKQQHSKECRKKSYAYERSNTT